MGEVLKIDGHPVYSYHGHKLEATDFIGIEVRSMKTDFNFIAEGVYRKDGKLMIAVKIDGEVQVQPVDPKNITLKFLFTRKKADKVQVP